MLSADSVERQGSVGVTGCATVGHPSCTAGGSSGCTETPAEGVVLGVDVAALSLPGLVPCGTQAKYQYNQYYDCLEWYPVEHKQKTNTISTMDIKVIHGLCVRQF